MATEEPAASEAVAQPADPSPAAGPSPRRKGYTQTPLGRFVDTMASRAIGIIVNVLVILIVVMLVWSVVALGVVVFDTLQQKDVMAIKELVLGVLTIFIIIEIFDLFREYLRSSHIRVTNLAEVSLAVVLRELWLLLLEGSTDWKLYIALATVVAALAGFWWLAHGGSPPAEAPREDVVAPQLDAVQVVKTRAPTNAQGLFGLGGFWYRWPPFSGRLAQWESARLTRGRSLVQVQHRPPSPRSSRRPPDRRPFVPNAETQRRGLKCPWIGCSVAAWPDHVYPGDRTFSSALPPGPEGSPCSPASAGRSAETGREPSRRDAALRQQARPARVHWRWTGWQTSRSCSRRHPSSRRARTFRASRSTRPSTSARSRTRKATGRSAPKTRLRGRRSGTRSSTGASIRSPTSSGSRAASSTRRTTASTATSRPARATSPRWSSRATPATRRPTRSSSSWTRSASSPTSSRSTASRRVTASPSTCR